jgi:small-conductance mechanosensitive channel
MLRHRHQPITYHQYIDNGPRVNVKVEKNSRGYNFEVTVTGASDVSQALDLIDAAETALRERYGDKQS